MAFSLDQFRVDGQVAIVTGAGGRGNSIGRAYALGLASAGAKVVVADLNKEGAAKVADEIRQSGGEAISVQVDITDRSSVNAMVAETTAAFSGVDILVNNAGITRDNLAMRMKDEEWDQVIRINLEASFRLMRASARPMMKARGGRIISITSIVGHTGNPGQMNYTAAKGGLTAIDGVVVEGYDRAAPAGVGPTRSLALGDLVRGEGQQHEEG